MIGVAEAEARLAGMSQKRAAHARRVAGLCADLAGRYGADVGSARLAGLLHDSCREWTPEALLAAAARHGIAVGPLERAQPVALLHGPVAAAELAAEGLDDDAARAIALHTVGGAGMTTLEKCLYLADFSEPGRVFPGVDEVRRLAETSLDGAVAEAARMSLASVLRKGRGIALGGVELYNELNDRLRRL
ncbi:MAG: bis(5'-nucleosyl)-tetraphosphatase (symmetrical) YqeK [Thermoleophilia bacterium]|nr:bis(5'-nucleosyl)-tetraphosphatase (symmetrical) YqeK [Thermoleophilia bacterium]